MRDKYIEHEFPTYFIFGGHANGNVDIATENDDTVATVSPQHAQKLIEHRNALVQKLCDIARAFDAVAPDEFRRLWYGRVE